MIRGSNRVALIVVGAGASMLVGAGCEKGTDEVESRAKTKAATVDEVGSKPESKPAATKAEPAKEEKPVVEEQLGPFPAEVWKDAPEVNTQAANSQPDGCDIRMHGEWIRVSCDDATGGFEQDAGLGKLGATRFWRSSWGNAELIFKMRKGAQQRIRICRNSSRASVFVSWPNDKERPVHTALGAGPACDGSEYGSGYRKPQDSAASPPTVGKDTDTVDASCRKSFSACAAFCASAHCSVVTNCVDACMRYNGERWQECVEPNEYVACMN